MREHTKGPWQSNWSTRSNGGPKRGWFVAADDADTYGVIAVLPDEREETEANARLIAAAPDLLGALQDALSELNDACDEDEAINHNRSISRVIESIQRGIAKAEGTHV